tara:strand:- start:3722 stop:4141 length:420 start_codon:yes stop_codon:yes gene_type:complete
MEFNYRLSGILDASKFIFENINSKIVLFQGDLGSGKTTLIKLLCSDLGINENVSSPTFPILNIYKNEKTIVYHADLYRLNDVNDLNEVGFFDIINSDDWVFIEWPDIVLDSINKPHCLIKIDVHEDNLRKLHLKKNEPQ